jgi:hypothetical protein
LTICDDGAAALGRRPLALLRPGAYALAALGVLAVVLRQILAQVPQLSHRLGDSDDATRLVQVREWLAGAPWFDTHTNRFGLADGLVSHWSRLVDAPIGGLIRLFGLFALPEQAEILARAAWPLLLLVPLFLILVYAAEWRGGRLAAAFAAFYTATCLPALEQFLAGRIDHHNAMIVCVLGAILCAARAFDRPAFAWLAGAFAGLGLAIGYEGIVLTIALVAIMVLLGLRDGYAARLAARLTAATAIALCLAFLATTAPGRWLDIRCDALSLNIVLAAGIGACGVAAMASRFAGGRALTRALVLLPFAIAAVTAYALVEPACLAGPFGQVTPLTKSYWLDHVMETRSLLGLFAAVPLAGIAVPIFLAAALAAEIALLRRDPSHPGLQLGCAMLVLGIALGCWQIKLLPYVGLLAGVPLAVFAAQLPALPRVSAGLVRVLFVAFFNLPLLLSLLGPLVPTPAVATPTQTDCTDRARMEPLNALPRGRVLGPIDIGPFVAAYTPHDALSAPYHRLNEAIALQASIWTATDMAEAERLIRSAGIRYVVTCAGLADPVADSRTDPPSLRVRLLKGEVPAFLEPLALPGLTPVTAFRLR